MDQSNQTIEALTRKLIVDLGIVGESEETQVNLLEKVGRNIFIRIGVAVHERVPEDKHEELDMLLEKGDFAAFKEFAKPYIADFDAFAQSEAQKEIEEIKKYVNRA